MAYKLLASLLLVLAAQHSLATRPLRGSTARTLLQQPEGATLRWSDEFNSLEASSWNMVQGDGTGTPPGAGWGNGEVQCYTSNPNNARIVPSTDPNDSGNSWLSISAQKQTNSCYNGPNQPITTQPWSSAKLTTQSKRSFMWTATSNLRVEARIKVPTGPGSWPAFWMLPEPNSYGGWCNSGEIDIMEHINGASNTMHGTLHYGGPWPTCVQSPGTTPAPTLNSGTPADWHVYAVDWAPSYIAFSMDGVEYYRVQRGTWWSGSARGEASAPFDQPFYIILNVAVGGAWPCPNGNCEGTPLSAATGPYTMMVDYIRVWDVPATNPAVPSPTPSPSPIPSPSPVLPVTYPACTFTSPCPLGTYFFCQAGGNVNGCSPTPFPAGPGAAQCSQQCMSIKSAADPVPSPSPLPSPLPSPSPSPAGSNFPVCTLTSPCPFGTYYFCQEGGNANGCSTSPFLSGTGVTQCSRQCLSLKGTPAPSASPAPLPSPSPTPSGGNYPACAFTSPCPFGTYYYCQAGGNVNGCSKTVFPAGTGVTQCSLQCLSVK